MSWQEDLKKNTAEELAALRQANDAWSKDLNLRVKILMEGLMKSKITDGVDEYASGLRNTNKDIAECSRRSQLLTDELSERSKRTLRAGASDS
jgi:hypothetical protein